MIGIDGSMGEGGGQVLRTSLTLAMLLQIPVEIYNIRAGRNKPGLLRQHLACVRAARAICDGRVEGDEPGSRMVRFFPGKVRAGEYDFAVGSAGSTVLVCQTVLLPLALADTGSVVTFRGGTHNGMSPSVTFLQQAFLPVLEMMGVKTALQLERYGFYPAGGGIWTLSIQPVTRLKPVELVDGVDHLDAQALSATAIISCLPASIAQRELRTLGKALQQEIGSALEEANSPGPGNILSLACSMGNRALVFEVVGETGVSAEQVARRTAGRFQTWCQSGSAVDEYLADQLLLPVWMAGGGCFTTTEPSLHTRTNMQVIQQLSGSGFTLDPVCDKRWLVALRGERQ
jgi:RNA 3'-terminal phosphate cyclase (ATP)